MQPETEQWLPLDVAAKQFGYAHKESLSRRLRQLRDRGLVRDTGRPPAAYCSDEQNEDAAIIIMWPNPKTALLYHDVPEGCLAPNRGRPTKKKK